MKYFFKSVFLLGITLCPYVLASSHWGPDWQMTQNLRDGTTVTVRAMKEADLNPVWSAFAETFKKQYQELTLEQLGKKQVDNDGKPVYTSVSEWLDRAAEGEKASSLRGLSDINQRHIVVETEERIIGYASVKVHDGVVAYFSQGYMIEEFQRRGAEQLFMGAIARNILPEEVTILTVLTRFLNSKAISAHQKAGFMALPCTSEEDVGTQYVRFLDYPPAHFLAMAMRRDPSSDVDCNVVLNKILAGHKQSEATQE